VGEISKDVRGKGGERDGKIFKVKMEVNVKINVKGACEEQVFVHAISGIFGR
jgi:hypothetical protein